MLNCVRSQRVKIEALSVKAFPDGDFRPGAINGDEKRDFERITKAM
jgi:hypothetical protein